MPQGAGPGPRIHPRARTVRVADVQIRSAVLDAEREHELTYGEIFGILADLVSHYARDLTHDERHPDKGGDEA